MQNNIVVAKHAGFCFGVSRATEALEKRIRERCEGERIFTLGHLIHNEDYIKYLESQGVFSISENDILSLKWCTCMVKH